MDNTKEIKKNREIDIIGLLKKIAREWKAILSFVLVFAIIGVVVALNTPKKYTTTVVLAPESAAPGISGDLGTFGKMLGLNMSSNSSDAIIPELYPNIFTSTEFLTGLYDIEVTLKDYQTVKSYYNHLKNDYKPAFWVYPRLWIAKLMNKFKNKSTVQGGVRKTIHLSEEQNNICNAMRRNIQCIVDQRTGLVTLTVTDIDEVVAAVVADTVTYKLQEYITAYRTKKSRSDLEYLEILCAQAEESYLKAQKEYADFADATLNISRLTQQVKLDNLESDMRLKQTLYSDVSQQLLLARQRVQERTPAFTVIQPAVVSLEASSMSRKNIVIVWAFVGFVAGALWRIYIKDALNTMRRKKKETKEA